LVQTQLFPLSPQVPVQPGNLLGVCQAIHERGRDAQKSGNRRARVPEALHCHLAEDSPGPRRSVLSKKGTGHLLGSIGLKLLGYGNNSSAPAERGTERGSSLCRLARSDCLHLYRERAWGVAAETGLAHTWRWDCESKARRPVLRGGEVFGVALPPNGDRARGARARVYRRACPASAGNGADPRGVFSGTWPLSSRCRGAPSSQAGDCSAVRHAEAAPVPVTTKKPTLNRGKDPAREPEGEISASALRGLRGGDLRGSFGPEPAKVVHVEGSGHRR
jgi:hypothetical protein